MGSQNVVFRQSDDIIKPDPFCTLLFCFIGLLKCPLLVSLVINFLKSLLLTLYYFDDKEKSQK